MQKPWHSKPYKIGIDFYYFQNHYVCSVCLAGGTLTWNNYPLHFSPYASEYPARIWNILGKFICNEVYQGEITTFLASLQPFVIQSRPEKPF